jgi:hypothetical protein
MQMYGGLFFSAEPSQTHLTVRGVDYVNSSGAVYVNAPSDTVYVNNSSGTVYVTSSDTVYVSAACNTVYVSHSSDTVYVNTSSGAASGSVSPPGSRIKHLTAPGIVVPLHSGREKIKSRLRLLRRLPGNHDAEGASTPDKKSVDIAIATVDEFKEPLPPCLATLDDDGSAVLEFEDRIAGSFADVTFHADRTVECYRRQSGAPSEFFEGPLGSPEVQSFLHSIGVMGQGGSSRNDGVEAERRDSGEGMREVPRATVR